MNRKKFSNLLFDFLSANQKLDQNKLSLIINTVVVFTHQQKSSFTDVASKKKKITYTVY